MPKILVADDSRLYVHLISGWLHERGFEVVVASDAIQAFVMATKGQSDAVILDISMPGGSGIDVLKKLKLSTKTKHIRTSAETCPSAKDVTRWVWCAATGFITSDPMPLSNRIGIRLAKSAATVMSLGRWRCFSNVGLRDLMPGSQLVVNFQRFGFADSWHTGGFHERADAL